MVELVDGLRPLGQPEIIGVEDAEGVNVPQQVGPAALLGTVIVVLGGVEVADQHAGKLIAQDLVHHGFAAASPLRRKYRRLGVLKVRTEPLRPSSRQSVSSA